MAADGPLSDDGGMAPSTKMEDGPLYDSWGRRLCPVMGDSLLYACGGLSHFLGAGYGPLCSDWIWPTVRWWGMAHSMRDGSLCGG